MPHIEDAIIPKYALQYAHKKIIIVVGNEPPTNGSQKIDQQSLSVE